jgi:mono/diheme cytochrome c family protein
VFKFTSTTYGSKPLREDLIRTLRRGIMGTSMPSFDILSQKELEAIVDYVLVLTHRGELERSLAEEAEFESAIDPARVPEIVEGIVGKWKQARSEVVYPRAPMPEFNEETIAAGKNSFLTVGCNKCHGDDGRGQTKENIGVDSWGNPTKAADLTSGMLRGGTDPLDVYRHIEAGINGTPMPAFRTTFDQNPQEIWNLVSYVYSVSDVRRKGITPEAGLLKPLPGVEGAEVPPAEGAESAMSRGESRGENASE